MTRLVAALCIVVATASAVRAADVAVPAPQPAAPVWAITAASEVRVFSWTSNRGFPVGLPGADGHGRGTEVYIPYAVQLVGRPNDDFKVEILGRAGAVWAHQSSPFVTGDIVTPTDTVANGTVTYLGLNGFQPFVSLSLNIPTGQSALIGTSANARMDPDLVDIASFGEGWNVGPTLGVSIPLGTAWMATTSLGYNWRGAYERDNSTSASIFTIPTKTVLTQVDPGDVLTLYGALGFQQGPYAAKLAGTISGETETVEAGAPLFQPGLRYLLAGTFSYTWEKLGMTTLDVSASHTDRNKVLFLGASALVTEMTNTNSNLFRIGVQHLFALDRLAIGPTASFLLRDRNGYDSATLQFVPAKERYALGALARYAATDTLTFNARVEGVYTHEGARPSPGFLFSVLANGIVIAPPVPVVDSIGLQVAVGANIKF